MPLEMQLENNSGARSPHKMRAKSDWDWVRDILGSSPPGDQSTCGEHVLGLSAGFLGRLTLP